MRLVRVLVSSAGIVTEQKRVASCCGPLPPIHPQDRNRIEPALKKLDYLVVPVEVLDTPYDGTIDWLRANDTDWYTRFFSWL